MLTNPKLGVLALLSCCALSSFARSDVAILADGRREVVEQPSKDSKGQWTAVVNGRRQGLARRAVVALVNDAGEETSVLPELSSASKTPPQEAALAALVDPKREDWFATLDALSDPPSRSVFEALGELASGSKKELRTRALVAMARLNTKESTLELARRVLDEKDAKVRRDAAVALFSVREIVRRSDSRALVERGLADADALVRLEFALVAPHELELAGAILRKDGLRNSDHHVRESAAVELGRRGDAAGEKLLIEMLTRSRLPGMERDSDVAVRLLVQEQVELCDILGRLDSAAARAALAKARSHSPHEAVRAAAKAALER